MLRWCAGDTLIGRVIRQTELVSPRVCVIIKLVGRAKTKITVSRGHGVTSIYRGRFNFFDPSNITLFDGPLHLAPQGSPGEWPFVIQIPKAASPEVVLEGNAQEHSQLSLEAANIATYELPPAYYFQRTGFSSNFYGCVEYYLTAELGFEKNSKVYDSDVATATMPIFLRQPSTPVPVRAFNLKTRVFEGNIKTHLLLPGTAVADLSLRQKTQKLFGSSKVPRLGFDLHIDCPTTIQLDNPMPISFKVMVVSDPSRTSRECDGPQTLTLTKLNIELHAETGVICPGTLDAHTRSDTQIFDFKMDRLFSIREGQPMVVPYCRRTVDGKLTEAPLDVGELLQLRVDAKSANVIYMGKSLFCDFEDPIIPSFETYNIVRRYTLRWAVSVSAAGLSTSAAGEQPVEVLPPSEAQMTTALACMDKESIRKNYDDLLVAAGIGGVKAALDIVEAIAGI